MFGWIRWITAGIAVFVSPTLKADVASGQWPDLLQKTIKAIQGEAWWVIPAALVMSGIAGYVQKLIGAPWVWEHVTFLLERIRDTAFPLSDYDGDLHHHRVTLFRYSRFCWKWPWPWAGWLQAVARTGHATQNRRIIYLAPDNADKAEGVAGAAWSRKGTFKVEDLPDVTSEDASPKMLADYAKATKMPVAAVQKRKPSARALYAITVETRKGVWGVIVLDTRAEKITRQNEIDSCFTVLGKYLGKLLEKS